MSKDDARIPAKVWAVVMVAVLGGGGGLGVGVLKTVTPADVSKQIALESPIHAVDVSRQIESEAPYLRDRALIFHQLTETGKKTDALGKSIAAIQTTVLDVRIEQRVMRKSIDAIEKAVVK